MLLAVDVGNSTTVVGVFRGGELVRQWRLSTPLTRTADELALVYQGMLGFADLSLSGDIDGMVVASVVPTATELYRDMAARYVPVPPVVIAPGVRTGIALHYDNPREIGADRIVNAVAVGELYGTPACVVDFGTSTNFDAVDADGAFVGGVIAPGVMTSTEALVSRAAQLPKVELSRPGEVIGRSTVSAMQSGIVYGFAGQVDAIVRGVRDELGAGTVVVATGGLAPAILDICRTVDHHDAWLTLKGLRIVWDRNRG